MSVAAAVQSDCQLSLVTVALKSVPVNVTLCLLRPPFSTQEQKIFCMWFLSVTAKSDQKLYSVHRLKVEGERKMGKEKRHEKEL